MAPKLPHYPISLNFAGRLYLIKRSGHKISARADVPFTCGFCVRECDEHERYSTLKAEAEDGTQVSFIFCAPCVKKATDEFPNMAIPTVDRAIAAKIERDGAETSKNVGLGDDEVRPYIGKRVSVSLTESNLWLTEENPEGHIIYTGVLKEADFRFAGSAGSARYEVLADDGTHNMIVDARQIERIDEEL
jgi:hypothetical protein